MSDTAMEVSEKVNLKKEILIRIKMKSRIRIQMLGIGMTGCLEINQLTWALRL
jgi:hypothetical protein